MSKKKTKKSSPKKLPIIIAAVVGIIAIILLVIFVVAPAIKNRIGNGGPVKPSSYEMVPSPSEAGEDTEYVIFAWSIY